MKKILKILIKIVPQLFSLIYTYDIHLQISAVKNRIYSYWIQSFLGDVGEEVFIGCDCQLQGGGRRNIRIGNYTNIGRHAILGCWVKYGNETFSPSIVIGDHCSIGEWNHITAINKITIGNGLLTGRFVYIGDNSHGGLSWEEAGIPPARRELKSKGEIIIGQNVWIGDKSTILSGVHIGDNVIIGANTVVAHDIPSNTVVVGGGNLREIRKLQQPPV